MLLDAAVEKMTEAADAASFELGAIGLLTSVEVEYMNALLATTDDPKRAKFVTVSLVIRAAETPEGDEYCLSVGAEIRGGKVEDGQLESDLATFDTMVKETVTRLAAYESKSEGVSVLANEASAEFEKLVEKLKGEQKKQRVISAIGIALAVIGIVVLFVVATLEGVK